MESGALDDLRGSLSALAFYNSVEGGPGDNMVLSRQFLILLQKFQFFLHQQVDAVGRQ